MAVAKDTGSKSTPSAKSTSSATSSSSKPTTVAGQLADVANKAVTAVKNTATAVKNAPANAAKNTVSGITNALTSAVGSGVGKQIVSGATGSAAGTAVKGAVDAVKNASSSNTKADTQPKDNLTLKNTAGSASSNTPTLNISVETNKTPIKDTSPKKDTGGSKPSTGSGGKSSGGSSSGSSSGSSGSGSSSASTAPTTEQKYAQAASTVNRITQGVDMSEKINEANQSWSDINSGYQDTTQPLIDQAATDRNQYIDEYADESQAIIDQLKGLSDDAIAAYANDSGQTIDQVKAQINEILAGLGGLDETNVGKVGNVSTLEQEQLLDELINAQREQSINQIDYATQQGVTELERALEDAAPQYQNMRNQIAANERQALDNQALYAEMRGDRGGIGQAQYGAIQNTAATNQLKVNSEQTKLATDTARQIADLRAQGEFKKADALLELTQSKLKQLMELKKWGDEMNVSIDEFNIGVDQWEEDYRMKAKELLADTALSATEYTTNLALGREKDLFNAAMDTAQQNASLNLSRTESLNQQRQELSQYLTNLGISNAQYMTDNQIDQLTTVLNQYMQNAQNMANTELSAANLTGVFSDKTPTMAMDQYTQQQLATAAQSLLDAGLSLTDDQIAALGWTKDQYNSYKKKKSSSGGGSNFYDSYYYQTVLGHKNDKKNTSNSSKNTGGSLPSLSGTGGGGR